MGIGPADWGPSVLLGTGDGFLATYYGMGMGVNNVLVADVDGDGHDDVLMSTEDGPAILLGDGAGGFGDAVFLDPGADTLELVAAADFDGNDRIDIVASHLDDDRVSLYLGADP
jgi:hypothetical protein